MKEWIPRLISALGLILMLALAWAASTNRARIP